MISTTEPAFEQWTVKELATPYYGHVAGDSAKALTLPKYQRNFVWTDKKRKELINSLQQGFPIGTLIVRKTKTITRIPRETTGFVEAETYELLDGLQRSTTLLLNRLNFLELISPADVLEVAKEAELDLNLLREIVDSCEPKNAKKNLAEVIAAWMKSCHIQKSFKAQDDTNVEYKVPVFDDTQFQTSELADEIAKEFEIDPSRLKRELVDSQVWLKLLKVPNATKTLFDISDRKIPVIIWEGGDAGAADIFERVNQGGVKLNRYQALAASWYSSITDIRSSQELGKLASAALSTKPAGAIVEKHGKNSENLDLYEALVGLSESLSQKYPSLFPPASKGEASKAGLSPIEKPGVNYYAFNIVAIVCGLKISDIANLRKVLAETGDENTLEVAQIFEQVSRAAAKIASALDCLAYANMDNNAGHTEAGMAALVASLVCHIRDGKNLSSISESNIRRHYIVDLIRGLDAKGHASDLAAFERVWSPESGGRQLTRHYTGPCKQDVFESALDEFWRREKERTVSADQIRRPKIDNVQKAMLRFYLSQKGVFVAINKSDNHHIDHVIPFMRARTWIQNEKGSLAVGAITNLAFLPEKLNLSKGSNTLDQWFAINPTGAEKSVKRQILDTYTKEQIWSLVPALEGESKELTKLLSTKKVPELFAQLQERIWDRMKIELSKL